MNLEGLLTHESGFRLTKATPLQRAICRAETGVALGELADHPAVIEALGGQAAIEQMPTVAPSTTVLLAAIRTAKSLKDAAKAFRATQVCDLSGIRPEEIARYSIVSLDLDKARVILEHLVGAIQASPVLSAAMIGAPTADSVFIRHPSGRATEIRVTAGRKAGGQLVSRWSIGASFDEAPRQQGQADGVVNLPDALTAVRGRLLPGAQISLVGSPWAPRGPVYDMFVDRFGRPGEDLLFMVAKGPDMNPERFTPEFCARLKRDDPRAYRTDVLALFADPEDSLLSSIDVELCTRSQPLRLEPDNCPCVATIDPATRRNAWTLVLLKTPVDGEHKVVLTKQWRGSKSAPLSPRKVLAEIAELVKPYGVDAVWSDQASFDALWELADDVGLTLMQDDFSEANWRVAARLLEKHVSEHTLELPPDAALRADILGMQRRLTARSWTIVLPNTDDGRHGDYAPALCLALKHAPSPPAAEVELPDDYDPQEQQIIEMLQARASNPVSYVAERLAETFN